MPCAEVLWPLCVKWSLFCLKLPEKEDEEKKSKNTYSHCLTKLPSYHLIKTLKAVKAEKELFCCVQYITSDKRPNSACVAALCSTTSNNRWLKTAKLTKIAFSLLCPSPQAGCVRSVTQSSIWQLWSLLALRLTLSFPHLPVSLFAGTDSDRERKFQWDSHIKKVSLTVTLSIVRSFFLLCHHI